jgi:cation diffusion facilitator CzcD-associated flavoprotein CzcO
MACGDLYGVIGAGASGLTVVKNLRQLDLPCECLEREDEVGGIWYYGRPHSSVYDSTHLISSKRLTEFTDFPMPQEWPPYPSRQLAFDYLRAYARHFRLYESIRFGATVERVRPVHRAEAPSCPWWEVVLSDGQVRRYRGLVIANGHNWDPNWPRFAGRFEGLMLHSCQYKTPDVLRGKRVLVVGAGNSGCDIAVESAQHAAQTVQSVRRGYHYLPKFFGGWPADEVGEWMLRWRLPLAVRRWIAGFSTRIALGRPERYGLPRPDHRLFETHPIINSQLLYYVGHGRIRIKPDVAALCGREVRFADGSREPFDVIVCATGFRISFPFIEQQWLAWERGRPSLYLNVFHPQFDNLCVAGLIQPDSGQWGLVDYQAQLIARFFWAMEQRLPAAERFRKLKSGPQPDLGHGIRYIPSPRHLLEVEHFAYRRRLQRLLKLFPPVAATAARER